jgi:predicted glutamine amidotransferase
MCELFAMSSKIATSVSFSLHEFSQHGGKTGVHADGWGLASYEGRTAHVYRETEPAAFSRRMKFIQAHPVKTHCVISHIRLATIGQKALRNTQPFVRQLGGRSHVFAHNGNLPGIEEIASSDGCIVEGETDSERAFCYLFSSLKPIWLAGTPALSDRVAVIQRVFNELAELGIANFLYSDGDYLYAFSDKRTREDGSIEPPGMYFLQRQCQYGDEMLKTAGVDIDCRPQRVCLFASVPLTDENWQPLKQYELVVAGGGDLVDSTGSDLPARKGMGA